MINQITENLWITDYPSVKEDNTDQFDIIIGVCQDSAEDYVSCEYIHYNMSDGEIDNRGGSHNYDTFKDAANTVLDSLRSGRQVLVHCHVGRSRSASVSAAALGVHKNIPYMDALTKINSSRQVNPEHTLANHAKRFIEENTSIDHTPFSG